MCRVVNKYKETYDVYIGRGSIWGNPYVMKSEAERELVIEQYRVYLKEQIRNRSISINMLKELNEKRLGCFCKPKACHGDVIVKAVEWAMRQL